jgi:hypothetical protein
MSVGAYIIYENGEIRDGRVVEVYQIICEDGSDVGRVVATFLQEGEAKICLDALNESRSELPDPWVPSRADVI